MRKAVLSQRFKRHDIMRAPSLALGVVAASMVFVGPCAADFQPAETVVVQGHRLTSSPDICLKIAEAKVAEWRQAKLLRDRTDTLADGTTRKTEMIFTENGVFEQVRGLWRTGQAKRNQRAADSAEAVAKRMGLSDCSDAGETDADGQSATRYTYSQEPGITTEIWVSKSTGLPLRMDIVQAAQKPEEPIRISMRYAYGDDVHVPLSAQQRNYMRMMRSQDWLRDMQATSPNVVH
jgi:hypothetical protein